MALIVNDDVRADHRVWTDKAVVADGGEPSHPHRGTQHHIGRQLHVMAYQAAMQDEHMFHQSGARRKSGVRANL
jgi:hypothetical protein